MRIQFISDLHLNSHPVGVGYEFETFLEPVAKALVICGDIGDPESQLVGEFWKWAASRWESIFSVPGFQEISEEGWRNLSSFESRIHFLKSTVSRYPNIFVGVRERFITEDGFLFLLCPFWTRIPEEEVRHRIPCINDVHQTDFEWLRREIHVSERPIVVATYCPPTYQMLDPYWSFSPEKVFFAAETELLLRAPVAAWITGHIHKSLRLDKTWFEPTGEEKHILVVSNPRGYQGEHTGFRNDAVLRIEKHSM